MAAVKKTMNILKGKKEQLQYEERFPLNPFVKLNSKKKKNQSNKINLRKHFFFFFLETEIPPA